MQVLLILAACIIMLQNSVQFAHSDLTLAGFNIEIGKLLAASAEAIAVAKLSNGPNQQSWWKLADQPWHDSAIHRYFEYGPLRADDMDRLADVSGNMLGPWTASSIKSVGSGHTDLMGVLQNLSTGSYRMSKTIRGTGKIEASMWTLLFQCGGSQDTSCDDGYLWPMVAIPKDDESGEGEGEAQPPQQPANASTTKYEYSYATLWLNVSSTTVLVNAIPFFIATLPVLHSHYPIDANDPQLSIIANVYEYDFPRCPSSVGLHSRSLLDASYGLVPGLACIRFSSTNEQKVSPLNLLVSHILFSAYNATYVTAESSKPNVPLEDLLSHSLHVNGSDQWEPRPFEECSVAMLMQSFQDVPGSRIMLRDQNSKTCILNFPSGDGSYGSCRGVQHLRFLHLVASRSNSCTYVSMDSSIYNSSCAMSPSTEEVCNAPISFYEFGAWNLLSPQSSWTTSTEGRNTSEFRQAPHTTDFDVSHTCIRKVSLQFFTDSSQASFHEAIQIRATSYLNSFITEHNIAFTTANGPATDLANFLALIVSTAISVILAIYGPFANFWLKRISRICPHRLHSPHGSMGKVVTVGFQMLCNVLLSICSFLPVSYLAWSEKGRESPFYTWDLGSGDQNIYSSSADGVRLRVVYLLSATSTYNSHFIIASTSIICATCLGVAICSAWRCKEILHRYTLLQMHDSILDGKGPDMRTNMKEDKETLCARALRAINMNEAEYVTIKAEVTRSHQNPSKIELSEQAATSHPGTDECSPVSESPQSRFLMDNVRSV